jgi:zinc transporter, ZIP family
MTATFVTVLAYAFVPYIGIVAGSMVSVATAPATRVISSFQHFAAGVVFAAVAVEVLPEMQALASPVSMVIGFCLGIAAMFAAKIVFKNAGLLFPIAIDLIVDGILIAVGFAAGVKGGIILLVGLTLETVSLGLSTAPMLQRSGMAGSRVVGLMTAIGLVVPIAAAVGYVIVGLSGSFLAGILGFGTASLLYLVTEELLAEAHEEPDTPLVTLTFFAGFLAPLVMASM